MKETGCIHNRSKTEVWMCGACAFRHVEDLRLTEAKLAAGQAGRVRIGTCECNKSHACCFDEWRAAEAKAAKYEADWVAAKHDFGVAMQAAKARVEALEEALRAAKNELGVPQPGYPMPVANACAIIDAALAAGRKP